MTKHQKNFIVGVLIILIILAICSVFYVKMKNVVPKVVPLEIEASPQKELSLPLQLAPIEPFVFSGKRQFGSNADLYKGSVIVEGEYFEWYPDNLWGGVLMFRVDEKDKTKIPKKYGDYSPQFFFENQSQAKQVLKIDESVFNNKSICGLSGRAKIEIKDYTVELLESEVVDYSGLIWVLNSTPQVTKLCTGDSIRK